MENMPCSGNIVIGFSYDECVFLFKFHHAIADGKSAFDMMYRQFIPILSAIISDEDADNVIPLFLRKELLLTPRGIQSPFPGYVKLKLNFYHGKIEYSRSKLR